MKQRIPGICHQRPVQWLPLPLCVAKNSPPTLPSTAGKSHIFNVTLDFFLLPFTWRHTPLLSRPRVRQKAQSRERVRRRIFFPFSKKKKKTGEIRQSGFPRSFLPELAATARSGECDQPLCLSTLSGGISAVTCAERTSQLSGKIITHRRASAGRWTVDGRLLLQCKRCWAAAESPLIPEGKSRLFCLLDNWLHWIGGKTLTRWPFYPSVIRQKSYWRRPWKFNAVATWRRLVCRCFSGFFYFFILMRKVSFWFVSYVLRF